MTRRIAAASLLIACVPAELVAPKAAVSAARPQAEAAAPEASAPEAAARAVKLTGRLPLGSGVLGTAAPTLVRAADRGERWVALCQARRDTDGDGKLAIEVDHHGTVTGDRMELFLALGGGEGIRIDAFIGAAEKGRWLAIVREGKVELVDAGSGETFALPGADAEADARPGAPHRAARFARDRLLYIRRVAGEDDRLVVRELADHSERELPVPGRLWRIAQGADRIAHLLVLPRDVPFPTLQTTLGGGDCIGPPMSYSSYGDHGPLPVEHWMDLETGALLAGADGKLAIGATIVRAPGDGALYFDDEQVAPPSCSPQLLAAMPEPARVIAICGLRRDARVVLLGKGLRRELAAIDRDTDHYGGLDDALRPASGVVCDGGLHCVATATSQAIDLRDGVADYAWGDKLYVTHATLSSRTHEIVDVVTGARAPIAAGDMQRAAGKIILDFDDKLVDLEAGVVLGEVAGALAVSEKGRALVGAGPLRGPLRWRAP